jgi:hypothetical protein
MKRKKQWFLDKRLPAFPGWRARTVSIKAALSASLFRSVLPRMKTSGYVVALLVAGILNIQAAQTSTISATPAIPISAPPAYRVMDAGANHRLWQQIVQVADPKGGTLLQTNAAYVELASGLNYWDATSQQWLASKEEIDAYAGGAIAQYGQHKVFFANNLNTAGAVDLQTSDGKRLQSHILGLGYLDTASGKSVLIAEVKDCQGQIMNGNQVIYADAFEGANAGVRYTYRRGSFEQDVILEESPPPPQVFGLNPASTVLQVLTEFDSAPTPDIVIATNQISSETSGQLPDEFLDFGAMKIIPGKAFILGQNSTDGIRVAKQWLHSEGRTILIEAVRLPAIAEQLKQLPVARQADARPSKNSALYAVSTKQFLPSLKLAGTTRGKMKLAKLAAPKTGLVLDYVTINTGQSGYVFQGDTTYYISGALNMSGTTTFEGGTVLKYAVNASMNFYSGASVHWQGAAYQPVVLTAKDDNSVGQTISGSSGNPTNYAYANPALNFNSISYLTISHFRIACAQQAMTMSFAGGTFSDGQIVNCQNGLLFGMADGDLRNLLFANVLTALNNLAYADVDAQNVTFGGSTSYGAVLMSGASVNWNVALTNCIIANYATAFVTGQMGNLQAGYNGFYNNNFGLTPFGSPQFTPFGNPFQTVEAGSFYLANYCGFQGQGTPNIDPTLILDLQTKTTQPPLVVANVTYSTPTPPWTPIAVRDNYTANGIAGPDLGYHYDPLDYLATQITVTGQSLLLSGGVAVGLFGSTGFYIGAGGGTGFTSLGRPNAMNRLTWYPAVQEQPVLLNGVSALAGYVFNLNIGGMPKIISLNFTELAMQGYRQPFWYYPNAFNFPILTLQNCWLRGVSLNVGGYQANGWPGSSVTLWNNLLERSTVQLYNGGLIEGDGAYSQNPLAATLYNNTFWQSSLTLSYFASHDNYHVGWTIKDNLFDTAAFTFGGDGSYASYIGISNDGFYNTSNPLGGSGHVPLTALTYATGPLGNRYIGSSSSTLIDVGSRSASDAGLSDDTIKANQTPDSGTVDIGYHYPILSAPQAYDDPNEQPCPSTPLSITLSGWSPDNLFLFYTVLTYPAHGTLSGTAPNLTYAPYSCYEGMDSFTFKVNDGYLDSAPATVTFTIADAVTANPVSVQTCRNTPVAVTLNGSDNCGEQLTYTKLSDPTHGFLTGTIPNYTYTPSDPNFIGTDSFTYKVSTVCGDSATDMVAILVAGAPAVTPPPIRSGFDQNVFGENDDGSTNVPSIPFMINFYGTTFSSLYVNENGNITFNAPFDIYVGSICFDPSISLAEMATKYGLNIIAPFWGDVDTRNQCSALVTYGINTVNGHVAFGANWAYVGYFKKQADKLNAFQLILIDRSDIAAGDFDLEFNYDQIQWESGAASYGPNGLGGDAARVGYASPSNSGFEFNGSGTDGALLDSNSTTGLIYHDFNSAVPGRYVFQFRNGLPLGHP